MNSVESLAKVGLKFRVSSVGPRVFSVYRKGSGAVWDIATYFDDILGRGGPDLLSKTRSFFEYQIRDPEVQEKYLVRVGMELFQEIGFSVGLTQGEFAANLKPSPPPLCTGPPVSNRRPRRISSSASASQANCVG